MVKPDTIPVPEFLSVTPHRLRIAPNGSNGVPTKRRDRVFCLDLELGSDAKQRGDETRLSHRIFLRHPPRSALANHVDRFDPLQRPPRRGKRAVAFRQPDALLYRTMVLFHHIIEVDVS